MERQKNKVQQRLKSKCFKKSVKHIYLDRKLLNNYIISYIIILSHLFFQLSSKWLLFNVNDSYITSSI